MRAASNVSVLAVALCLAVSPTAGGQSRPSTPVQFTEVADADWNIDKPLVGRERKCDNGKITIFPCQDVNLLSFLPISSIGGGMILNDVWGWTDSATGREFVLVGHTAGTSFVEITDPVNPRYLGVLPGHGELGGIGRGVKAYKNYAFVVADAGGVQGLQVFDLTQLRSVKNVPVVFRETAFYDRMHSAHNLVIDTASGFAYAVGNNGGGETCNGGLHMIDIRKPLTPTFAGCYAGAMPGKQNAYVHDAQCVVYRGPDQRYRDREICLSAAAEALEIVDVTDKQQPKRISIGNYPAAQLTHQGWLTDDQRYFFLDDEGDQQNQDRRTRTIVFDLSDLSEPIVVKEFLGANAIDHNQYIRGHHVYQSNYAAGLRVLDIADPKEPREVGYFDTDVAGKGQIWMFSGAWGNYPYFKNGAIAVTSMGDGLFILRHRAGEAK